jgi:hypothetical protein
MKFPDEVYVVTTARKTRDEMVGTERVVEYEIDLLGGTRMKSEIRLPAGATSESEDADEMALRVVSGDLIDWAGQGYATAIGS